MSEDTAVSVVECWSPEGTVSLTVPSGPRKRIRTALERPCLVDQLPDNLSLKEWRELEEQLNRQLIEWQDHSRSAVSLLEKTDRELRSDAWIAARTVLRTETEDPEAWTKDDERSKRTLGVILGAFRMDDALFEKCRSLPGGRDVLSAAEDLLGRPEDCLHLAEMNGLHDVVRADIERLIFHCSELLEGVRARRTAAEDDASERIAQRTVEKVAFLLREQSDANDRREKSPFLDRAGWNNEEPSQTRSTLTTSPTTPPVVDIVASDSPERGDAASDERELSENEKSILTAMLNLKAYAPHGQKSLPAIFEEIVGRKPKKGSRAFAREMARLKTLKLVASVRDRGRQGGYLLTPRGIAMAKRLLGSVTNR